VLVYPPRHWKRIAFAHRIDPARFAPMNRRDGACFLDLPLIGETMTLIKIPAAICVTAAFALLASDPVFAQASETAPAANPVPTSSHKLTRAVQRAFARTSELNSTHIAVRATNGVVSLSGTVPAIDQVEKAESVAQSVPGVIAVKSLLSVHDEGH
jgi:hyperosmotically inducible protein